MDTPKNTPKDMQERDKVPTDMFGQPFYVGARILRPEVRGSSAYLVQKTVMKIEDGKVYLNLKNKPLLYPERCFILDPELGLPDAN